MKDKEIILQIRINRLTNSFELAKIPTNNLEEVALESFLNSYCKHLNEERFEQFQEDYFKEVESFEAEGEDER